MAWCKSCGAEIQWCVTPAGKSIPIDAKPTESGNLVVVKGVARYATEDDDRVYRPRRISHFATCPDADGHRRASS